eukprot:TCONS_00003640-protein
MRGGLFLCLSFISTLLGCAYGNNTIHNVTITNNLPTQYNILWFDELITLLPADQKPTKWSVTSMEYQNPEKTMKTASARNLQCSNQQTQQLLCIDQSLNSLQTSPKFNHQTAINGSLIIVKFEIKIVPKSGISINPPVTRKLEVHFTIATPCLAVQHLNTIQCLPEFKSLSATDYKPEIRTIFFKIQVLKHAGESIVLDTLTIRNVGHKSIPFNFTIYHLDKIFYTSEVITSLESNVNLNTFVKSSPTEFAVKIYPDISQFYISLFKYYNVKDFCQKPYCYSKSQQLRLASEECTIDVGTQASRLLQERYQTCHDTSSKLTHTLKPGSDLYLVSISLLKTSYTIRCNYPDTLLPYSVSIEYRTSLGSYKRLTNSKKIFSTTSYDSFAMHRCRVQFPKTNLDTIYSEPFLLSLKDVFKGFLRVRIKAVDLPKGRTIKIFTEQNILQHITRLYTNANLLNIQVKYPDSRIQPPSGTGYHYYVIDMVLLLTKATAELQNMSYVDWVKDLEQKLSNAKKDQTFNQHLYGWEIRTPFTCRAAIEKYQGKSYRWPLTGTDHNITIMCPTSNKRSAVASCTLDKDKEYGRFKSFDYKGCVANLASTITPLLTEQTPQSQNWTEILEVLVKKNMTIENANETMTTVVKTSAQTGGPPTGPYEINHVVTLSEMFLPFIPRIANSEKLVFEVIDLLLGEPRTLLEQSQEMFGTSERLVDLIGSLGETVSTNQYLRQSSANQISFNRTNFALIGQSINVSHPPNEMIFTTGLEDNLVTMQRSNGQLGKNSIASIEIPHEVFSKILLNRGAEEVTLVSVGYRESKLFSRLNKSNQDFHINSCVMSAEFRHQKIDRLQIPVILKFRTSKMNMIDGSKDLVCSFWNETTQRWSNNGMSSEASQTRDKNFTTCQSTHLTNFAVFLRGSKPIEEEHETALTYISYIGLGISVCGDLLTILTFAIFPTLRENAQPKILINLCLALVLMSVTFVYSGFRLTDDPTECKGIAFLMQYFLLTVFSWSLVEAFHTSRGIISPLKVKINSFLWKTSLVAWGTPLIYTGIIFTIFYEQYGIGQLCFMEPSLALYIGIILPVCLALFINVVALCFIMRALTKKKAIKRNMSKEERNQALHRLRIILIFCCIFSLTWLTGIPMLFTNDILFQYTFCIINSLQGCYIFITYCLRNKTVLKYWKMFLSGKSIRQIQIDIKHTSYQLNTKSQHRKISNMTSTQSNRLSQLQLTPQSNRISTASPNGRKISNILPPCSQSPPNRKISDISVFMSSSPPHRKISHLNSGPYHITP